MADVRNGAKRLRRIAQVVALVVATGVIISFGVRSFASTVELADRPATAEIPEALELFGTGALLVAMAASARRVVGRGPQSD